MPSVQYVKFRDIDSSVLKIIQSTRRGEDLSALINWGRKTRCLSVLSLPNRKLRLVVHLECDRCGKPANKLLYEVRKALKQGSRDNLITLCARCHQLHHLGTLALSPKFPQIAAQRSASMTSKLKDRATSLLKEFSSTTASL